VDYTEYSCSSLEPASLSDGVAYMKVQDGHGSVQSFSKAQNVMLSYNEDGDLIDRGTVEGAQAIRSS
jgi:hypothetical protein